MRAAPTVTVEVPCWGPLTVGHDDDLLAGRLIRGLCHSRKKSWSSLEWSY